MSRGQSRLAQVFAPAGELRGDELDIEVHRDVAVLGIVGERVTEVPGLLAKVSHSLSSTPQVLLLEGSQNSVVTAVADGEKQLGKVLRAVHEELGVNRLANVCPESLRFDPPAGLRSDWADLQQA